MASSSRLPRYKAKKEVPSAPVKQENIQNNGPQRFSQEASSRPLNTEDLLTRKVEAEFSIKTAEENIEIYQQKCLSLVQQQKLEELALQERIQKTAIAKARSSLSRDQAAVCRDLTEKAERITEKLAYKLADEVCSPEKTFVFNPNARQLECAIKSSIKQCLELEDKNSALILDCVKNNSSQERLKALIDVQNELKEDLSNLVNSIDVNEDTLKLSKELKKLEIGELALLPLDFHIKEFSVKHARSVLDEQDLMHENKKLERQLEELLQNNPDVSSKVKSLMEIEQVGILETHLNQFALDDHQCIATELEQERTLKKILNLHKELENLRHSVMKGLSTLENISYLQQKLIDEMQGFGKSCKEFEKILELEQHLSKLLKLLYLTRLTPDFNTSEHEVDTSRLLSSADMKGLIRQLDVQYKHECSNTALQADAFQKFKVETRKLNDVITRGAAQLQQKACEAHSLYLDHESAPRDFNEKLQAWKENPVERKLADDSTRTVSNFGLQDWIEIFTENHPEINCLNN